MKVDVVIIGGSLAGASCARELARLGVPAVAFEREVFPRPKVCGGFVSPNAVECLDRLDLLDLVRAAGAVEVDRARIHAGGTEREVPLRRKGLGISRGTLDEIVARGAPVHQGINVRTVVRRGNGFVIETDEGEVQTAILIDAAGKLSRFTRRSTVEEFGIQFFQPNNCGSVLDFWFFEDGYGGGVGVENGRSNFCFLIKKKALGRYLSKVDCLCTGPLAYDRDTNPGNVIAIGDAAGMIDPFCGEGIHHALDSAMTAVRVVAQGLRHKRTYAEIRQAYEVDRMAAE